jgi:hypothetical protein
MHERVETWNEANPEGRWRCFGYNDLLKRDKLSLDLFWIKNKTLSGVGAVHEDRGPAGKNRNRGWMCEWRHSSTFEG